MHKPALFALLLSLPLLAQAQVYKWVDEKGRTHYSQTPPKTGKMEEVPKAPPPGALGGSPDLQGFAEGMQSDREKIEQNREIALQNRQRRTENCAAAKHRQAGLKNYKDRIFTVGADGGREMWSAERQAAERAKADSAIEQNCNP